MSSSGRSSGWLLRFRLPGPGASGVLETKWQSVTAAGPLPIYTGFPIKSEDT